MAVPEYITNWFAEQNWQLHHYQADMFSCFAQQQSVLLVAPTGGGKTLASFLPAISDIHQLQHTGLHTLYISPLKALTADIQRNLIKPINEMNLNIRVDSRTGDTSSYRRQQQLKKPPNILLTTPESLMLLLSYTNAPEFFKQLKLIIIDEIHSFAFNKRGDLTALALAQLNQLAHNPMRVGLSATVAHPQRLAQWLVPVKQKAKLIQVEATVAPSISLLDMETIPYGGHMARHAVRAIYKKLKTYQLTLIFVNTRAQAEFLFRQLWIMNQDNYPIAIYHGSLSKEGRQNTEQMVLAGQIKAIVATSALELGIDWGNVDAVIQVGAPHGVSRLVQRIGRSNHQFNQPSKAYIAPTNCFNSIESQAAIDAIAKGTLDDDEVHPGSLDVAIQFIVNCACSQPIQRMSTLRTIRSAFPYRHLEKELFNQLFQFAVDGGYVLQHYPQYHRLIPKLKHNFIPASASVIRRHRQNIGTIIEAARLRVKILNKRSDKIVGDIEESFIQELAPGDSFLFAGEILEFVRVHDLLVETRKIKAKDPRVPSYAGGTMPLSTFLAAEVLQLMNQPKRWQQLPQRIQEWLSLQQQFSLIPTANKLLIEQFKYKRKNFLVIYSFEGRRANHSLGMLLTRRMEELGLKPIYFTATDYALCISTLTPIDPERVSYLFAHFILADEVGKWMHDTTLLKRTFRQVAIISGLTERQIGGSKKSMKQVTFSTDLIYDVLKKHEPNHVLLRITEEEVKKSLLDLDRVAMMLKRFQNNIQVQELSKPSPFSIPILCTFATERVLGEAQDHFLAAAEAEVMAVQLITEVKNSVE